MHVRYLAQCPKLTSAQKMLLILLWLKVNGEEERERGKKRGRCLWYHLPRWCVWCWRGAGETAIPCWMKCEIPAGSGVRCLPRKWLWLSLERISMVSISVMGPGMITHREWREKRPKQPSADLDTHPSATGGGANKRNQENNHVPEPDTVIDMSHETEVGCLSTRTSHVCSVVSTCTCITYFHALSNPLKLSSVT